jgi:hypothetical protein
MLRGRLYLVTFILISNSLVFIPIINLQGDQNPYNHQHNLPNSIAGIFEELACLPARWVIIG